MDYRQTEASKNHKTLLAFRRKKREFKNYFDVIFGTRTNARFPNVGPDKRQTGQMADNPILHKLFS